MRYNENIAAEYGDFQDIAGRSPVLYKPVLSKKDYSAGSFIRVFAKKINENSITEISGEQAGDINKGLYQIISIQWTISGPRDNKFVNGAIVSGVYNQNTFELDRAYKESGVDLRKVLQNPLEYWRGF